MKMNRSQLRNLILKESKLLETSSEVSHTDEFKETIENARKELKELIADFEKKKKNEIAQIENEQKNKLSTEAAILNKAFTAHQNFLTLIQDTNKFVEDDSKFFDASTDYLNFTKNNSQFQKARSEFKELRSKIMSLAKSGETDKAYDLMDSELFDSIEDKMMKGFLEDTANQIKFAKDLIEKYEGIPEYAANIIKERSLAVLKAAQDDFKFIKGVIQDKLNDLKDHQKIIDDEFNYLYNHLHERSNEIEEKLLEFQKTSEKYPDDLKFQKRIREAINRLISGFKDSIKDYIKKMERNLKYK